MLPKEEHVTTHAHRHAPIRVLRHVVIHVTNLAQEVVVEVIA